MGEDLSCRTRRSGELSTESVRTRSTRARTRSITTRRTRRSVQRERHPHFDANVDRLAVFHARLELPLLHRLDRTLVKTVDRVERLLDRDIANLAVGFDHDVEDDFALDHLP